MELIEKSKKTRTREVAAYIVLFFLIVILALGGHFLFVKNQDSQQDLDFSGLIDPDFNKLLEKLQLKDDETEPEYEDLTPPDCIYQGQTIKHLERVPLYSRETVGPYEDCEKYKSERMCSAGLLVGGERFKFFTCQSLVDCETSDGQIVKDGETRNLYSREVVEYGDKCSNYSKEIRCEKGKLLGEDEGYKYNSCYVSLAGTCEIDGQVLADGRTHTFFSQPTVKFDERCSDFSQTRFCEQGYLQGDTAFQYWSCTQESARSCYLDGVNVAHGGTYIFFSRQTHSSDKNCLWFSLERECYDGVLSGPNEYEYASCQ